jgi:hypothetical protein
MLFWETDYSQSSAAKQYGRSGESGVKSFIFGPVVWNQGFPRDLEHYWIGHAPRHVSDQYSALKEDVEFREVWAEKVGLGFELPTGLLESKSSQLDPIDPEKALEKAAQFAA